MTKQELINLINDRDVVNAVADIITSAILSTNVENPSNKSIENPENTLIIGTPVEVTERHVGCLVYDAAQPFLPDVLWRIDKDGEYETVNCYTDSVAFTTPYPVPITHRWFGGQCPVDGRVTVLVQFRSEGFSIDEAGEFFWERDQYSADGDIIGYTVIDIRGIEA